MRKRENRSFQARFSSPRQRSEEKSGKRKRKSSFSTWLTNGVRKKKRKELVGCISQEFQSAREKNGRKMDLSPPLSSVVSLSLSLGSIKVVVVTKKPPVEYIFKKGISSVVGGKEGDGQWRKNRSFAPSRSPKPSVWGGNRLLPPSLHLFKGSLKKKEREGESGRRRKEKPPPFSSAPPLIFSH